MKREISPTEARSGVASGRVVTVLVISAGATMAAFGIVWMLFGK